MVDGHDLSVVASTQNGFAIGPTRWMNIEWLELDETWMPASLDAAQNLRLKGAVTEILDRNLPATIESMKLLQ